MQINGKNTPAIFDWFENNLAEYQTPNRNDYTSIYTEEEMIEDDGEDMDHFYDQSRFKLINGKIDVKKFKK